MRRVILAVFLLCAASAALASDAIVRLSGWAEIPSTYRHPGPVSGQFAGPANGVTPPYDGQPIPGFSGMIPSPIAGSFIALPDNGYGAQGNSADFVIGLLRRHAACSRRRRWHDVTRSGGHQRFHAVQRSARSARCVVHHRRTGLQPHDLLSAPGRADSRGSLDQEPPAAHRRRLRRRVHRADERRHVLGGRGVRTVSAALRRARESCCGRRSAIPCCARRRIRRIPSQNPANLPSSRGFESMTRNADGSMLYVTTEASINSEPDKRMLLIYEFDTRHERYTARTFKYAKDSSELHYRRRQQRDQHLRDRRHDPRGRRPLRHHRARRFPGTARPARTRHARRSSI